MEISSLKDIHKNESVFVIGNGPSVNDIDFRILIDKNMIVTNCFHQHPLWSKFKKIYHIELNGAFRINYETTLWKVTQMLKNKYAKYVLRYEFKPIWDTTPIPNDRKFYLKIRTRPTVMDGYYHWDISKGSLWANTGVIEGGMALSQYMGFKNVYLIGCDVSGFDERGGYFYNWKETPEVYHPRLSDRNDFNNMIKSWYVISEKFRGRGINIYNLSKFSKLGCFENRKIEDVV